LAASAVTVNGIAVTSITAGNGQYTADISGIMSEITKCACKSACEQTCPGSFLMVTGAGPWSLNATIVVEGYVSDGGNTCQFRACFNTATGESTSVTGAASFALCGVDIPCQISGIAPSLLFSFDACSSILNPQLSVTTCNGSNALQLTGSLVTTPSINMKITRQSLFQIHACEVDAPCDDLGQCDPCNPDHEDCFEDSDNCCCGYSSPSNSNGHCGQNYL
jgi:hypothetical protein